VFGFCFICSAFVVDVQAMVYHFCSLQMVLVHIVKSIRWVIESSRNANLFVVPKRSCLIFRVKGLYRTVRYVIYYVICILGLGGCSFACGASVCRLSASLCDFLCVVFYISLSWVAEGDSGGVPAEYGCFLQPSILDMAVFCIGILSLIPLSHGACLPL